MITVSGPKSRIERIKEIAVEVDVTGASRTFSKYAEPKALDEDGKEIDTSRLTFSKKYITVDIELYKKKDINLQITTNGEPEDGYIVKNVEYEPKTVTVAGEACYSSHPLKMS
jgi:YbbR domain-containing protein